MSIIHEISWCLFINVVPPFRTKARPSLWKFETSAFTPPLMTTSCFCSQLASTYPAKWRYRQSSLSGDKRFPAGPARRWPTCHWIASLRFVVLVGRKHTARHILVGILLKDADCEQKIPQLSRKTTFDGRHRPATLQAVVACVTALLAYHRRRLTLSTSRTMPPFTI